jgi:hypothetical protein
MLIKYIVPEDGDEQAHPNVFTMAAAAGAPPPSLGAVKRAFPLPGTFHFRCLRTINAMTVWLDAVDDTAAVGASADGTIFLKATRISAAAPSSGTSSAVPSRGAPATNAAAASAAAATPRVAPTPAKTENLLQVSTDDNDTGSTNLLDSDVTNDLLGFSPEPTLATSASSGSNLDLFGMDSLQPARPTPSTGLPGPPPPPSQNPGSAGSAMRPPPQPMQPHGFPPGGGMGMMPRGQPVMMGGPRPMMQQTPPQQLQQQPGQMQFDPFASMATMRPNPSQQQQPSKRY